MSKLEIKLKREIDPFKNTEYDYQALKLATDIQLDKAPPKPATLLKMFSGVIKEDSTRIMTEYFTVGDISSIVGRSGQGKSNLVSLTIAEMLHNTNKLHMMSYLDKERPIIIMDTEQSEYDVWRISQKICTISGISEEEFKRRVIIKRTEPLPPKFRKMFMFDLIKDYKPQLLVLDGVADIISTINDEATAKDVVAEVRSFAQEHKVHIIGMIHASDKNKTSDEAMGWIGTVWKHKSEGQMNVSRKDGHFDVKFLKGRHGVPQGFSFNWNIEKSCPEFEFDRVKEPTEEDKSNAILELIANDALYASQFFADLYKRYNEGEVRGLTSKDLNDQIRQQVKRRAEVQDLVGRDRAAEYIKIALNLGIIINKSTSKTKKDFWLNFDDKNV
ncbi:MAG: hypothetical protein K0U41_05560 [Gammaproteobacteria bacterium]|nr:hypothetical protein [Gammaproteobacteria bacterium]